MQSQFLPILAATFISVSVGLNALFGLSLSTSVAGASFWCIFSVACDAGKCSLGIVVRRELSAKVAFAALPLPALGASLPLLPIAWLATHCHGAEDSPTGSARDLAGHLWRWSWAQNQPAQPASCWLILI